MKMTFNQAAELFSWLGFEKAVIEKWNHTRLNEKVQKLASTIKNPDNAIKAKDADGDKLKLLKKVLKALGSEEGVVVETPEGKTDAKVEKKDKGDKKEAKVEKKDKGDKKEAKKEKKSKDEDEDEDEEEEESDDDEEEEESDEEEESEEEEDEDDDEEGDVPADKKEANKKSKKKEKKAKKDVARDAFGLRLESDGHKAMKVLQRKKSMKMKEIVDGAKLGDTCYDFLKKMVAAEYVVKTEKGYKLTKKGERTRNKSKA